MLYAIVLAALTTAATVQALPSPGVVPGSERQAKSSTVAPYDRLFQLKSPARPDRPILVQPVRPGRVIEVEAQQFSAGPCGMPVVRGDARLDPKIVVPIPEREKEAAKIRVIEPTRCR